jgi:imidazolonepropionase-like amidohydrolase
MKTLPLIAAVSGLALVGLMITLVPETPTPAAKRPQDAKTAREFVVRDARVFDGEKTWPRASVHVREGRIIAIAESIEVPKGAEIADGQGKTLLPGLIDSHVHTWGDARRDALRFGVTTMLDMFSSHHLLAAAKTERASLAATDQADLWSAGTLATAAGGHGTQYGMDIPTLASPADAAGWVAARKGEGSDWIKIVREDLHVYTKDTKLPTLDDATAAAVIAAAHDKGLMALVHASAQESARSSLRDGADGLVHVFQDAPADEAFVALARERGAFVVPTLGVIAGFAGEREGVSGDPRIAPFLSSGQKQTLQARMAVGRGNPALIANARESVRRLHAAGVPVLAGSDAPNPNTAHGAAMHEELVQLVRTGLTPSQALAAATSVPARAFALADRGRIAAGLRADLVLVEGDPTVDIQATRAIVAIWKNGRRIARSAEEKTTAPVAIKLGMLGDFEATGIEFTPESHWFPTTDRMMGGASTVEIARISGGVRGSLGALRISGEIASGAPWPWAGVMYSPSSTALAPVDARVARELVFMARGDGRDYTAMLFSGEQAQSAPVVLSFKPGVEWTEIRLPLADFAGADLGRLRALGKR